MSKHNKTDLTGQKFGTLLAKMLPKHIIYANAIAETNLMLRNLACFLDVLPLVVHLVTEKGNLEVLFQPLMKMGKRFVFIEYGKVSNQDAIQTMEAKDMESAE